MRVSKVRPSATPERGVQLNPEETSRNDVIRDLRRSLDAATDPLDRLLASARLCAWDEVEPYRRWPSTIGSADAARLPGTLRAMCFDLIGRLRSDRGEPLAATLLTCQDACFLLQADRAHGNLLQEVHDDLEGVVHECGSLLLDDEASVAVAGFARMMRISLVPPEWSLGILRHPLGETQRLALASTAGLGDVPVKALCQIPVLEGELVFDGGRPSPRMIESFQRRQGMILCGDGTRSEVRAVLEVDWRVSVEFDADQEWCNRIDGVRLGALPAESLDEQRDTWAASLASYGLDTKTKMVGQPILVALSTGERFSM